MTENDIFLSAQETWNEKLRLSALKSHHSNTFHISMKLHMHFFLEQVLMDTLESAAINYLIWKVLSNPAALQVVSPLSI